MIEYRALPAKSQVLINAEVDPAYAPYCMTCPGLRRMRIVDRFLWRCLCGAEHDERPRPWIPTPLEVQVDGPTLHVVLAALGWRSEGDSELGRQVFDAAGCPLGRMSAAAVWAELRYRGLIVSLDGDVLWRTVTDEFHEPRRCACSS